MNPTCFRRTKIYVRREPGFRDAIDLWAYKEESDGSRFACTVAAPFEFKATVEGVSNPPSITINEESAQQLMDELWGAGLRPTEGNGSAGAMAAVQQHLEDLRKLVFKT